MSDLAYSTEGSGPLISEPVLPPAPRNYVFFGPNGLRAGWGMLLFALLAAIAFMVGHLVAQVGFLTHPVTHGNGLLFTPKAQITEALIYIVCVVVAAILLASQIVFDAAKAAASGVVLLLAVTLLALGIVSTLQGARAKADGNPPAAARQTPAATPASTSTIQELRAAGSEAVTFAVVLFITWLMSRIEHRSFGEYGLGGNSRRWPQLGQGLVAGFGALSLLVLGLYLGHWIVFNGSLLHSPGAIVSNGFLWLLAFVMVGFFEEFFFRGYLQYTLARGIGYGAIGFFIAAALFNFSFGFAHGSNPGESPIGLFTAGLIGFVFCISLWYTRSLWWAIGFHATWDWGESFFYGTADSGGVSQGRLLDSHPQGKLLLSGGATGPEGSALCLLIILLIAIFVWLTLRKERDKATNQALINPLVDPLVPVQSSPLGEAVA